MAVPASFLSFDVFPLGFEDLPKESNFAISDVDQVIPANFIPPCLIFTLPPTAIKDEIILNLRTGLQSVLTCIPLLGAKLRNDTTTNQVDFVRKSHEPITLNVHHLDQSTDSFPTYEMLAATGFSPGIIARNVTSLTPPHFDIHRFRRDDGCPVAGFQANFIHGGLILSLVLHHMCGDAKSTDHVFALWAASTKAAMNGQPMPSFEPSLNRSYFNANSTPSPAETESLKSGVKGFGYHEIHNIDANGVVTNEPPPRPVTTIQIYHFGTDDCHRLKSACTPTQPGAYVSTYDCIAAATWRAMVRARLPYLGMDAASTKSNYSHPVDTRGRFPSLVRKEYFGNGFIMALTESISIDALISEGGLAQAASAIRQSILDVKSTSIPDLVHVRRGIQGSQTMEWDWQPQNVMGTSWTGMRLLEAYDFGFGFPKALRIPVPPYEGLLGVLPAVGEDGQKDGFDVFVVMEKECSDRMTLDGDYTAYCSVRG
ncbi:hypothetical protein N7475_000713 [Penicillium sp. IBT 31633x]|nr:hypothetical protein N7475_000713 [Penicillium sp. IBT 31633x]